MICILQSKPLRGLNKSHQVWGDSSYVDRMPNVIWRLDEHEIGPGSAPCGPLSLCDVILSLDARLAGSLSIMRNRVHAKTIKNAIWHIASADILSPFAKWGPSIPPPPPLSPVPVCFCSPRYISFPHTHDPSSHWDFVISPCLKFYQYFLTASHTHIQKQQWMIKIS